MPKTWIEEICGGSTRVRYCDIKALLTYFERGSITVHLTSCFTGWDLASWLCQLTNNLLGQIQTSQIGGQLYSETSHTK